MSYELPTTAPFDGSRDSSVSADAAVPPHGSASPIFALKLSESAQKEARQPDKALPVITAILNKAIRGSGAGIHVKTLYPADLLDKLAILVARIVCTNFDYKPVDFAAWYKVRLPAQRASSITAPVQRPAKQNQHPCGLADDLVRRLNGPGFPEVQSAEVLRAAPLLTSPATTPARKHSHPVVSATPTSPVIPVTAQAYLGASETGGIEATYAQTYLNTHRGDTGNRKVYFVDIEQGWDLTHVDLPAISGPPSPSINYWSTTVLEVDAPTVKHGTAAVGVVLMTGKDTTNPGVIGVAPNGVGSVISEIYTRQLNPPPEEPQIAIANAITQDIIVPGPSPGTSTPIIPPGDSISPSFIPPNKVDVILLECQTYGTCGSYGFPVELKPSTFDIIYTATSSGVVVVEAAGDANVNLGDDPGPDGKSFPLQGDGQAPDSGAIMVGAANAATPDVTDRTVTKKFPRMQGGISLGGITSPGSNYGNRVNVFAWGNNVYTTAPGNTYTPDFNLTSSAAAIIAGAAMLVQSLAIEQTGQRLPALQVRDYLTGHATNSLGVRPSVTKSADATTGPIGVMPNLKSIMDVYMNIGSQASMRSFTGDDGSRPAYITSRSPDIIVAQSVVYDPQLEFGSNSARNDETLSQRVLSGQLNFIHVRLLNSGGENATDVSVDVYWAPPTTVPTPGQWKPVGTTILSCVPNQNVLMVSDAIEWVADGVPEDGYVCLIAVVGSKQSPAPIFDVHPDCCEAAKKNDDFLKVISANRNIAISNVNLVPPARDGQHFLGFSVPCNWNGNKKHTLEALGSLPRSTRITLFMPLTLVRQLHIVLRESCRDDEYGEVPVMPMCRSIIGEGNLRANEIAQCELLVQLPERMLEQQGIYEFAVRHVYDGQEVGRVTWRFEAPKEETLDLDLQRFG
jgi:hypothetical protein